MREIMLERQTEYRYTIVDLKPYTKYIVQISAGTVVGMGPHVSLENKTLQAGKKHKIRLCREFSSSCCRPANELYQVCLQAVDKMSSHCLYQVVGTSLRQAVNNLQQECGTI